MLGLLQALPRFPAFLAEQARAQLSSLQTRAAVHMTAELTPSHSTTEARDIVCVFFLKCDLRWQWVSHLAVLTAFEGEMASGS